MVVSGKQVKQLCAQGMTDAGQKVSISKDFQGVRSDGPEHTCFVSGGKSVIKAVNLGCLQ